MSKQITIILSITFLQVAKAQSPINYAVGLSGRQANVGGNTATLILALDIDAYKQKIKDSVSGFIYGLRLKNYYVSHFQDLGSRNSKTLDLGIGFVLGVTRQRKHYSRISQLDLMLNRKNYIQKTFTVPENYPIYAYFASTEISNSWLFSFNKVNVGPFLSANLCYRNQGYQLYNVSTGPFTLQTKIGLRLLL